MQRRCTSNECLIFASRKSRAFDINASVVQILPNPQRDWLALTRGNMRIASDRKIEIDWSRYNLSDYLFTHCTIVSSVNVEDDGYRIIPPCDELINNNGNGWTEPIILATFRTFIGAENYCFPAGTRVLMSDGTYKNIEDVREGDFVINRLGKPDRVIETKNRRTSKLVEIESLKLLSRKLRVTSEHPFYVFHANETCPKTGRKNKEPRLQEIPKQEWTGFAYGVHKAKGESFVSGFESKWCQAGQLDVERDFFTTPISDYEVFTDINEAKARLIGWFLAEGSYVTSNKFCDGESGVQFSLSSSEKNVAKELKKLLVQEFGKYFRKDCEPRIYEHSYKGKNSYVVLTLSNIEVAKFFLRYCGKYSWRKSLHESLMWAPKRLQAIILHTYLQGDGCDKISSRGFIVDSKSRKLIQQLLFVANRLKLNPVYKEMGVISRYSKLVKLDGDDIVYENPKDGKKSRPSYLLRFSSQDSKRLLRIIGEENVNVSSLTNRKNTSVFKNDDGEWIVSRIKNTKKIPFDGIVYNLEVEGDNSYVVEGVVVHNCEHVQVPALSKGKILDAVVRPVVYTGKNGKKANVKYVDILVATERKHTDLIRRIESSEMDTLSMGCFQRGTLVTMSDGTQKSIETVEKGEKVITHRGFAREVTRPIKTHWFGDIYKIWIDGRPDPIICTGNHKFWALTRRDECSCGCGLPLEDNAEKSRRTIQAAFLSGHQLRILNPMITYSPEKKQQRQAALKEVLKPKFSWKEACKLEKGDFLTMPCKYEISSESISTGKARLLGLYLAEGNLVKQKGKYRCVEFSYSIDERETLARETQKLLKEEFNVNASLYVRKKSKQCQIRTAWNEDVVNWFKNHGGHYSWGKEVTEDVVSWPLPAIRALVGAWFDGDGCLDKKNRGRLVGATVSPKLASQLSLMLTRIGVYHSWKVNEAHETKQGDIIVAHRAAHYITVPSSVVCKVTPYTTRWADGDPRKIHKRFHKQLSDDFVMCRIKKVEQVRPISDVNEKMYVYCLEVEEEHSLTVGGGIGAENCIAHVVTCSKCGKTFTDNDDTCIHLKTELLSYYTDKDGKQRIVAELCGKTYKDSQGKLVGDPESLKFIEASWVARPAFKGAVLNHFVSQLEDEKKAASILAVSNTTIEEIFDNLQHLRVADKDGMLALKVTLREMKRLRREAMAKRVAVDYFGHY